MNVPEPDRGLRMRRRFIYRGRVQRVGFRATAAGIARRHPVAGFVRNLPDGTVELVLDGPAQAVAEVLAGIARAFEGPIDRRDSEELPSQESFEGFTVRH